MTTAIIGVVVLAFVCTVAVWIGLDALNGAVRLLHDEEPPKKPVPIYVIHTQADAINPTFSASFDADGHLSAEAEQRIHRQVRGIH